MDLNLRTLLSKFLSLSDLAKFSSAGRLRWVKRGSFRPLEISMAAWKSASFFLHQIILDGPYPWRPLARHFAAREKRGRRGPRFVS